MKYLGPLLVVLGVCVSALGASGFHRPDDHPDSEAKTEENAWLFFVGGLLTLGAGGVLMRLARHTEAAGRGGAGDVRTGLRTELEDIRATVVELDTAKETLSAEELRDRIDELLSGPYFDLTSKSDDLMLALGFSDYARVWEGVATAERLLGRSWSLCTDGYPEEGRTELPHARAALDGAVQALASL